MKKCLICLLTFLLAASALCEKVELNGTIEYPGTITVYAGTGGTVDAVHVTPGQKIEPGALIAGLSVTRVFMPWDGEIRAVNVTEGETASVQDAVLYEYKERYLLKASMDYAYADDTPPVSVGERFFLACAIDNSHTGYGYAVNVSGTDFDILTTAGEFYPGEVVNVYRGDEANPRRRAGAATVYKADYGRIAADGYITRVYCAEGSRALKGEALFDIALGAEADRVISTVGGIVSTVLVTAGTVLGEDTPVLKLIDEASVCIAVYGTEAELTGICAGNRASAVFRCDRTETPFEAVVTDVTMAPDEAGLYRLELKLPAVPSFLREGMSAAVAIEIE